MLLWNLALTFNLSVLDKIKTRSQGDLYPKNGIIEENLVLIQINSSN